ncbi:avidin-like, partial [Polyodon spathula]|uniref:avidin-like n=1 Tax=Polyodon spathula TaxID=7913 RepID=UPI001B7F751D
MSVQVSFSVMKNMILFSTLVLLFRLASYTCKAQKCNLEGKWINDLGSNMIIYKRNNKGIFFGSYFTAVTTEKNVKITPSPISGVVHNSSEPVFAFLVKWSFSDSITSFTGQCFDGKGERLETMWLRRAKAKSSKDNWVAT